MSGEFFSLENKLETKIREANSRRCFTHRFTNWKLNSQTLKEKRVCTKCGHREVREYVSS